MTKLSIRKAIAAAKKYKSRTEFLREDASSYSKLQREGLLREACSHMQLSPLYSYTRWNHETVWAEAQKYKNRSSFRSGNEGAYAYALRNNILDLMFPRWHIFDVMAVALKYDDWAVFISNEKSAYNFVNRHKLTDMVSSHMRRKTSWGYESVLLEAKKYKTRGDFFLGSPGAYKYALKTKIIENVCAHMDVRKRNLTKDDVLNIALSFSTRSEFQELDGGAYVYARLNGFLDEACEHMERGTTGFREDIPATLYQFKLTLECGLTLYKVGITNRETKHRLRSLSLFKGVKARLSGKVEFDNGRDARILEKQLHKAFESFRYDGPAIMTNGMTEVFTVPLFNARDLKDSHAKSYLHTP